MYSLDIPFGKFLKKFRDKNKITQEEIAKGAQIRVNHVGAIERGERKDPHLSTVLKICNAVGKSFDVIVGRKK